MRHDVDCPVDRNMPPPRVKLTRVLQSVAWFIAFCVIASVALLWALGYRVNWTAKAIEQTSILQVSTVQAGLKPTVYVDGILQPDGLPLTMRWLFPGQYDVEVRKEGYHSWTKSVRLSANQRANISSVLMLYENPVPVEAPVVRIDDLSNRSYNNSSIEVRSGNELWVRNAFITRTSGDIINPEFYFDNQHVVYQTGNSLVIRDLEAETSQTIVSFTTTEPVPYVMQENGRVLVYLDGEVVKALQLFEQTSLIDRFTGR